MIFGKTWDQNLRGCNLCIILYNAKRSKKKTRQMTATSKARVSLRLTI